MLVALLTILLLGGGLEDSVLDYAKLARASIGDIVVDDTRQAEARATLKEIEKLTKDHAKSNQKAFKSLLEEMNELENQSGDVDAIWAEYSQSVDAYNRQMINLRFKLRDSLSREEWNLLFSNPA